MAESFREFSDIILHKTGARSYSQLAMNVGISRSLFNEYRQGRTFPSDETMCQLATRADLDVDIALLWLNVWRAKGIAKTRYTKMLKTMMGFFLIAVLLPISLNDNAFASTTDAKQSHLLSDTLYYEKFKRDMKMRFSGLGIVIASIFTCLILLLIFAHLN